MYILESEVRVSELIITVFIMQTLSLKPGNLKPRNHRGCHLWHQDARRNFVAVQRTFFLVHNRSPSTLAVPPRNSCWRQKAPPNDTIGPELDVRYSRNPGNKISDI